MSIDRQDAVSGFDPIAKSLHWLIVVLLMAQYAIAWTMPEIHRSTPNEGLVTLHLSVGGSILLIMVVRLAWRLSHSVGDFYADLPAWWRWGQRSTHILLYTLLIVIPLMGWANASYRGWPIDLGLATLPMILPKGDSFGHALGDVHALLANVLLYVAGLHIAAALYHHFIRRDRILARILPARWLS